MRVQYQGVHDRSSVDSFCSWGLGNRELYEITFILLSSLSWEKTSPSPTKEP